jgi:hypothetical protein
VRCRQIGDGDASAVAGLLAQGFPARDLAYWTRALDKLRTRETPAELPRYGYLLETEDAVVGVLLLIFSVFGAGENASIRCNVSSWYVDPRFRSYAALLTSAALKHKHVTYLNTSPEKHTLPMLQARDYVCYSDGQFVAFPMLAPARKDWPVTALEHSGQKFADLPEIDLLTSHFEDGCTVAICDTPEGLEPFVFIERKLAYAPVPVMQLVYCRDTERFVACAGPLGRFLGKRGVSAVICDANGPLVGLKGLYFAGKAPRYYRGPHQPRLNDLAFTEAVLFGA